MAGGRVMRGALTAWMSLIVLQVAGTANGSGRIAEFFTDANRLVKRALAADVAAIPDRRYTGVTDADGNFHPAIPGYLGGGVVGGPGKLPPGSSANPGYTVIDPAPFGGGNPAYNAGPDGGATWH